MEGLQTFHAGDLILNSTTVIDSIGLLRLTNTTKQELDHTFYPSSFSTSFIFGSRSVPSSLHQYDLVVLSFSHATSPSMSSPVSAQEWENVYDEEGVSKLTIKKEKIRVHIVVDKLETKKIILVHGEGFGAWCWYKIIPLLEEAGLHPVALDLTGSGINHANVNSIMTLADYTKPLLDYLHNLHEDEKVILLGHSCGGASVSFALERFPKKITKAIFLGATMVLDGQRPFDVFAEELASAEVFMQESQLLMYDNGKDKPPTGLMLDKEQLKGLYFNQSPSKDIALASVSMRPIPLAPVMEKLSLTAENYGSIPRYFIQMLDDRIISSDIQEKLVRENPPRQVFKLKGSDHCPFFSKPQSLCKVLLEIAQLV